MEIKILYTFLTIQFSRYLKKTELELTLEL